MYSQYGHSNQHSDAGMAGISSSSTYWDDTVEFLFKSHIERICRQHVTDDATWSESLAESYCTFLQQNTMLKLKELRERHKYVVHVQVLAAGVGMHSGHTFLTTTNDRYICITHRTRHYIVYIHCKCIFFSHISHDTQYWDDTVEFLFKSHIERLCRQHITDDAVWSESLAESYCTFLQKSTMAKLKEIRKRHKYIVNVQVWAAGVGMHSGHTFLQTANDRYICITHRTKHYIVYIHSYCHPL